MLTWSCTCVANSLVGSRIIAYTWLDITRLLIKYSIGSKNDSVLPVPVRDLSNIRKISIKLTKSNLLDNQFSLLICEHLKSCGLNREKALDPVLLQIIPDVRWQRFNYLRFTLLLDIFKSIDLKSFPIPFLNDSSWCIHFFLTDSGFFYQFLWLLVGFGSKMSLKNFLCGHIKRFNIRSDFWLVFTILRSFILVI